MKSFYFKMIAPPSETDKNENVFISLLFWGIMSKALLIVDMQNGFITKKPYSDLVSKINSLIEKNNYEYYIFTKFINRKNSFYVKKLGWENLLSEESQKICVSIPHNNFIFEKNGYGLSQKQIEKIKEILSTENNIDICGLQTDACVYAISLQLFDNDIYPNILINYTATLNNNKAVKAMLIHQFGKVDERP